jgi:hypothetical protein
MVLIKIATHKTLMIMLVGKKQQGNAHVGKMQMHCIMKKSRGNQKKTF